MKLLKGMGILWQQLTRQGLGTTAWWAADHLIRIITGANIHHLSRIMPQLHVGIPRMKRHGITPVISMRKEYDDEAAGIAFLHVTAWARDLPLL